MRILAIGNMYPPHHQGGYEIVWQAAMRRAAAAGHEVRVLTSVHREPGVEGEEDDDVHRSLRWYLDYAESRWRELGPLERLRLERENAAIFARHVAEFRPDVVSFWAMGAMSLSLVERVAGSSLQSILVVHDDWLVYGPKGDAWIRMFSRRRAAGLVAAPLTRIPTRFGLERGERVVANSEFILNRAREHGYSLPDATVVRPGIEAPFLSSVDPEPWRWRLLYVGRLDRRKGIDIAIETLARLPAEANLTVAGAGDAEYEAELRARAGELGVAERVSFLGHVGHGELPAAYAAADALIFPVRWQEPFGLVPLEAMGVGRPVVATARGGATEYLRDGENALVVPADDPAAAAAALERLANDEALRRRLGDGGVETAAAHTSALFEERMVGEIERAAEGSTSA